VWFKVFIVDLDHDEVPDLNFCIALPDCCKPKLVRAAIRFDTKRMEFKFGNIFMI
jgi:hypothetical protein